MTPVLSRTIEDKGIFTIPTVNTTEARLLSNTKIREISKPRKMTKHAEREKDKRRRRMEKIIDHTQITKSTQILYQETKENPTKQHVKRNKWVILCRTVNQIELIL